MEYKKRYKGHAKFIVPPGRSKSILNVKKSEPRLGWCDKNI
jgi:hypothetical protein